MLYIVHPSFVVNSGLEHVGIDFAPNLASHPLVSHDLVKCSFELVRVWAGNLVKLVGALFLTVTHTGVNFDIYFVSKLIKAIQKL